MDAKLRIDHQMLAVEQEHGVHCMLELQMPEAHVDDRTPLSISLVIDRSGSMSGEKLDVAKECARYLTRRLSGDDHLALITYDDSVDLVAPLAPVDAAVLEHALAGIGTGGMTNLSGGWLKGLEEIDRAPDDGVRRVLLLTDGQANVGIVDRGQLVSIAQGAKDKAATTTIGFGADFDEDLLAAIAAASDGATYYAENPDDAPAIFAEEFANLATLVAQNVSVEIRPADPVELLGVLNEYPIADVPGGLQVQLGDAYGSERRRVVFRMRIPEVAKLGVLRVADVVLRYVTVGESVEAREVTIPITVNLVSADEAAAAEADHEVVEETVLLASARARKRARDLADMGDIDGARTTLESAARELRDLAPHSARGDELVRDAEMLDTHTVAMASYGPEDRKRLTNESWRRDRGRPI
ncbi:MAG: VWA domain-containing protein [Acidimicrobiia bacterium]|nr:VWA domain-containing protein [Acidimicrobiia bacterium]